MNPIESYSIDALMRCRYLIGHTLYFKIQTQNAIRTQADPIESMAKALYIGKAADVVKEGGQKEKEKQREISRGNTCLE